MVNFNSIKQKTSKAGTRWVELAPAMTCKNIEPRISPTCLGAQAELGWLV